MDVRTFVHLLAYIHVCIHRYTHTHTYTLNACAYTYIHTNIHTYIYKYGSGQAVTLLQYRCSYFMKQYVMAHVLYGYIGP